LDEADPEVLRDVEAGLESWLAAEVRHDQRRTAGVAALNNILEAAPERTKHGIFQNLVQHDRQLAVRLSPPRQKDIEPPMRQQPAYTFADLVDLDDAAVSAVLHRSNAEVVVLALAGAAPELIERVMRQLPLAEARTLRYALENLGPTRLSDVEQAQQHLADLACRLARDGQLKPGPRKRLSIAV
jgi:flagellar motor switch protein FliG